MSRNAETSGDKRPPLYLVAGHDERPAILPLDWPVALFDPAEAFPDGAIPPVVLLLWEVPDTTSVVAQLRSREDPLADAPIIVVGSSVTVAGADEIFVHPPEQSLFDLWNVPSNLVVQRLVACFGAPSIRPLLNGLREALRSVRTPLNAADAHHFAGLAGTLGYADLAAACDAAQHGNGDDGVIRREIRKAIYDIGQRLADLSDQKLIQG